jgi:hypothetical protein
VPRGRVLPHGRAGRRVAQMLVERGQHGWVRCNWAYVGNYVARITVLDSRSPEARRCQDPAGQGLCRVVFENDAKVLKTADRGARARARRPARQALPAALDAVQHRVHVPTTATPTPTGG